MAKRALIIRPDYNILAGFSNSAASMTQALRARGFDIVSCEGREATRAGILSAYDTLTESAGPDDSVVIYYVGHGGRLANSSFTPNEGLPPYFQHICPTDFAQTTEDDFRGISAPELSLQQAKLTSKTKNVTAILDCCFAAQMSRGDDPPGVLRVSPVLTRFGIASHLQSLRQRYPNANLSALANPDAVRVTATGQDGCAFQITLPPASERKSIGIDLPDGGWINVMTLCLLRVLAKIGDRRINWRSVGESLRAGTHIQRPEVEGPVDRIPFSLKTADGAAIGVKLEGTTAALDAGRLLGVSVGDVYAVMPAGSTEIDPARLIADITISDATEVDSHAQQIAWQPGQTALPDYAVALPRKLAFERYPVRVVADDSERANVEAAVNGSLRVRAATPQDGTALAELRIHQQTLELWDPLGPLFSPSPYPARLSSAVADLENIATAHRLRVMADHQGIAPDEVSVQLLAIDKSCTARALADSGSALGLGDRIAVVFKNKTKTPVFAYVFNIGLRCKIAMLGPDGGIPLPPRPLDRPAAPVYCGINAAGKLVGFRLTWPTDLLEDQPRIDTIIVIVTRAQTDLSALVRDENLSRPRGAMSPLQALLDQIACGGTRGEPAAQIRQASPFAIYWRNYQLFPISGSLNYGEPQVDASPPGSPPLQRMPGPGTPAATAKLCLDTLTVAENTRVDILVCAKDATTPYRATTLTAATSNQEIWTGELRGAIDVYVWTSPQDSQLRPLADLLLQQPTSEPAAKLRGPHDAVQASLASGASMQLAALARTALCSPDREVTTAFHASFGTSDGRTTCTATGVSFGIALAN